jgi:hypothetical protein
MDEIVVLLVILAGACRVFWSCCDNHLQTRGLEEVLLWGNVERLATSSGGPYLYQSTPPSVRSFPVECTNPSAGLPGRQKAPWGCKSGRMLLPVLW